MNWGVAITAEGMRAVCVRKSRDGRPRVTQALDREPPARGYRIGLPLRRFSIDNLMLPPVAPREVAGVVDLQAEFHASRPLQASFLTHEHVLGSSHLRLHLISLARSDVPEAAGSAWPAPLALVGLAAAAGAIDAEGDTLLAGLADGKVLTVALSRGRVVFLREFDAGDDFTAQLRMSAQAVYLRERAFLQPHRFVLIGDARGYADEIPGDTAEILTIDPGDLVASDSERDLTAPEWLVPLGLALLDPRDPACRPWNAVGPPSRRQSALRWAGWSAVPAVIAAGAIVFAAAGAWNRWQEREVADQLQAHLPDYAAVREAEREIEQISQLRDRVVPAVRSPRSWVGVLDRLERARPYRVALDSVSGNLDDAILINGVADHYLLVSEYMTRLGNAAAVLGVELVFTRARGDNVEFQLSVKVDASAVADPLPQAEVGAATDPRAKGAGDDEAIERNH